MTLKHEAGHAALGHTGAEDKADEEEAEAAFFAKYASAPPLVHRIRPKFASDLMISFGLSYEAAKYAFAYYQKWLQFSSQEYLPYERELLKLFSATA